MPINEHPEPGAPENTASKPVSPAPKARGAEIADRLRAALIRLRDAGLLPRRLSSRIGLLVMYLLLVSGFAQNAIAILFWVDFLDRKLQEVNVDLANSLAEELRPLLAEGKLEPARELMRLFSLGGHGEYQAYILNHDGSVVYPPGHAVDPAPLERFLANDPVFPIRNRDPIDMEDRPKVFSVAPVMIGKEPGYVYVVLKYEGRSIYSTTLYWDWALSYYLIGALISALIVLVLAFRIISLVSKPLYKLSAAVDAFRKGRYQERLDFPGGGEVGQLAMTFNQMAETIDHTVAELTRIEHSRRELVAHISHDLRGPVASAIAAMDVLSASPEKRTTDEQVRFVAAAKGSVLRVQQLIADLFELSKLELMEQPKTTECISFPDLVNDLVIQSQGKARASSISLKSELPDEALQVQGDSALLERAVNNLLENAIRYTPAGKAVCVSVLKQESFLVLSVADEGPGIPEADLALLGQPFHRVAETMTKFEGTGLGLAIVKRILALHGTALEVSSKLGLGSSFGFRLPICPAYEGRPRSAEPQGVPMQ